MCGGARPFYALAQVCHTRTRKTSLLWLIRRLRGRAAKKRPHGGFEPGAFCFARAKRKRPGVNGGAFVNAKPEVRGCLSAIGTLPPHSFGTGRIR